MANNPKSTMKQSQSFRMQMISNNTNQILKNKLRELERISRGKKTKSKGESLRWEFYMNFMKNEAEIYEFQGNKEICDKLNAMRPFFAEALFWNGQFAVSKFDKLMGIYQPIRDSKRRIDGSMKSAHCKTKYGDDEIDIVAGKNGAFMQTDVYKFPIFLFLDVYLDPIIECYDLLTPELQNSLARLLIIVNDSQQKNDTLMEQIASITDTASLIKVINSEAKLNTQDLKADSINDKLWQNIKSLINLMYQMRGRKTNVSEKASGVAQSEVLQNNEQFEVVVENRLTFWNKFCEDFNESYQTNIKMVRKEFVEPENDKKEDEQDENKSQEQSNNKNA